ncbi:MAG: hypothetical protein FWG84_05530 [Bacteroidales bacterium]|nr:hypothetical protein [Bacteroidales bacterium]
MKYEEMKLPKQEKKRKAITVLTQQLAQSKQQLVQSKKRIKPLENKLSTSERKRKTLLENILQKNTS